MRTWIQQIADSLSTSFWFLPGAMACAAALLAVGLLFVDYNFTQLHWPQWLRVANVEGVRELLSSLVGSIITVLGVLFSITIVALTLAASQLGPRLLRNFMRDRINQVILGVFVATYVYCLIILFAVGRFSPADQSLPQSSTIAAFLLGLASLAMLIYFIHHLAMTIQAPNVLAMVARELHDVIRRSLPDLIDEPHKTVPHNAQADDGSAEIDPLSSEDALWNDAATFNAPQSGYMQAVDLDSMMTTAIRYDLQLKLLCRPGDFVAEDESLISLLPPQALNDKLCRMLKRDIYIGRHRTATQDLEFVLQELVEVALRAISPSINDPITAINAVDYLGDALRRITIRHMPPRALKDTDGRLRIVIDRTEFDGLCDIAFNQIRQHSSRYPDVLIRVLENLTRVARRTNLPDRKRALWKHGRMILTVGDQFTEPYDRQCLAKRFRLLHQALLPESETFYQ